MTKIRGSYLLLILSMIVLVIAYCAQPMPIVKAQPAGTATPNCGYDAEWNWVCFSSTNDLTVTPTETDWITESPTSIPTATITRRSTATATSPALTPFVPTDTPTATPSVTPVPITPTFTPTIVILPLKRFLFLPIHIQ